MTAPLYLCLHLRDFAAQALVHSQPELRSRAVAVMSGVPPLEQVFAMLPEARRLGLREGMSRVQAESFPTAILRRKRQQEDQSFTELMRCTGKFSPRVEPIAAPQEDRCGATLMLDVAGSGRLLGEAREIGTALWQSVHALGFESSVASSQRASVALLVARGTQSITTIAPGNEAATLAPLPLAVLEPDVITAQTFESWGIHTLRQLAELPSKPLAARLGMSGIELQRQARGECGHLLVPAEEPLDAALTETLELEHPVELLEPLLFLLSQMLDAVLQKAAQRSLAIASVETCLMLDGPTNIQPEHRRMVRPTLPERNRLTLLKLIQLDLETHPPASAVVALRITARPARAPMEQHGLFATQAPEAGRMEILLARLRKLVGENRVGSPELLDSHASEAFRVSDFTIAQTNAARSGPMPPAPALAMRMVRPPCAVSVEMYKGAPYAMDYEGRRLKLQNASGPWRTNGAWWMQAAWSREEWDVTVQDSRCLRLAHDPGAHCWYVIGIYD